MRELARKDMGSFLEALTSAAPLIAPVREDGQVCFRRVDDPGEVVFDYVNTERSPKDFFFPQTEAMFRYRVKPAAIEPADPPGPRILFGIRPCDLAALGRLDAVFLGGDCQDAYYRERRQATALVAVACSHPDEASCFCTAFDLSPGEGSGADLMLYPGEASYVVEALTARGEELLEAAARTGVPLPSAGTGAEQLKEQYRQRRLPLGDAVRPGDLWRELDARFNDPYWEEASRRCLGCGICTYLCPTCHCFLVTDETRGEEGLRLRCWDSCQFDDFLLMAGGHNPRPTKKERTRQRFLHKLDYFVQRFGEYLCTGCGRCVAHCPVGLDMATVLADLKGVTAHV